MVQVNKKLYYIEKNLRMIILERFKSLIVNRLIKYKLI